jgi:hypothetical protein
MLLPYAGEARGGSSDPNLAAMALANALANFQQDHRPVQEPGTDHPLRQGQLFNDEQFLAAIWKAYPGKQSSTNPARA